MLWIQAASRSEVTGILDTPSVNMSGSFCRSVKWSLLVHAMRKTARLK